MKKPDLVKRLARKSGKTIAEAADELDRTVHRIVQQIRRGQEPSLPGLGKFRAGKASDERKR
jgi:nucleoid DNA-binding protein